MKQSNRVLTAIAIALGLSACDSGDPTVEDATNAADTTEISQVEEAVESYDMQSNEMAADENVAEQAIGAIDDAVDAMVEAGDAAMDDAADTLDKIVSE
ncbi:MAG: hypothetical protein ACPHUH_05175 [Porticoccaceae bacterium]